MSWVVWRLHRNQAAFAGAALAVVAVVLGVTGVHFANEYNQATSRCGTPGACQGLGAQLFQGDSWFFGLVELLTVLVPVLLGVFWGAPLFAKELEEGTHKLAWIQTVTRRRWMVTNLGWVLAAAAVWAGALSALVTWWSGPENAVMQNRLAPLHFSSQGIVPLAYALFAVCLGIAAGVWLRRVLPAIAVTVGGYIVVSVIIGSFVRSHYLAPVVEKLPFGKPFGGGGAPVGSWMLSEHLVNAAGNPVAGTLPAACHGRLVLGGVPNCLSAAGWHQVITYQPASRFWAFQGIESGIFVVMAAALLALACWRLLRVDA